MENVMLTPIEVFNAMTEASFTPQLVTGPAPGPGWNQVNRYIQFWNNIGSNQPYLRICFRLCAVYVTQQDLLHHAGTIHGISARSAAVLSMTCYDILGYGPVVGGLNGNSLSPSNPFASSGVEFQEVRSALLTHATNRFEYYKLLEEAHRSNIPHTRPIIRIP